MPAYVTVLVFGSIGLIAAWAVRRDLATGVSNDEVRQYSAEENPIGYPLAVLGKVLTFVFCAAMVLHAFGLVGNPIAAIRATFPFLPDAS